MGSQTGAAGLPCKLVGGAPAGAPLGFHIQGGCTGACESVWVMRQTAHAVGFLAWVWAAGCLVDVGQGPGQHAGRERLLVSVRMEVLVALQGNSWRGRLQRRI